MNSRQNSLLTGKTLGLCLALLAVTLGAIFIFNVPVGSVLLLGVVLLCPLMHLLMMHREHGPSSKD